MVAVAKCTRCLPRVTFHPECQVDERVPTAQLFGQGSQRPSEVLGAPRKTLRPLTRDVHYAIDDHISR